MTTEDAQPICYNCGRPRDHRFHTQLLPYPCPASLAQPFTLWTAVLGPAIASAAREHGIAERQAFEAVYDRVNRQWVGGR